jgi:hypothetical protein
MMHLDPRTYSGLLAGTLPPGEARVLSEHLSGDCETCERFLAGMAAADGLDGRSDAAIVGAFPPPLVPGGEREHARIQRRLRGSSAPRRRLLVPIAIAASLVMAGVAGMLVQRAGRTVPSSAGWDGVKGTEARPIRVRLRAVQLDTTGSAAPLRAGESLDPSARLLFEVEAERGADVALVHLPASGGAEIVWRSRVASGRTVLTTGGRAAAYPLAGLAGAQRFAVLAAEGGLDDARVARVTSALARPGALGDAPALAGVSVDLLELSVR